MRAANAGIASYLFQALDRTFNYTFSVEQTGALRWGATSRAAMDTSLYRSTQKTLKTDGSFVVADKLAVGPALAPDAVIASSLQVNGSQSLRRRNVEADYTVTDNDYYIGVSDTSRGPTIRLPSAWGRLGRVYIIKDESGKAGGAHPITVRACLWERIDGANAQPIRANYGVLRVLSSGKNWFTM